MADSYGGQSLPLSSVGAAVVLETGTPDPLLTRLCSYFKACANARLGTEFAAAMAPNRSGGTGQVPVMFALEHDPELFEFNDKQLPALFIYRSGDDAGTYEDLTTDMRVSTETVTVLWVLPSGTQEKQAIRARFPSKLFHLFDALIEANRDPAWLVVGDADANAATQGSSLAAGLNLFRLRFSRGPKRKPLVIRPVDDKPLAPYPAYEALIEVREMLVRDPARNAALGGANVILRTEDGGYGDGGKTLEDFDLDAP